MWNKFLAAMEKVGRERAYAQLRRLGYTPEVLAKIANQNLTH